MDHNEVASLLKARRFADIADGIGPDQLDDFRMRVMKSVALGELGRFTEALANLDCEISGQLEQTALWVTRANLHLLALNLSAALAAAMKALEFTPGRSEAVLIASRVLIRKRRYGEAIALLEGQDRELSLSEKLTLAIVRFEVSRSSEIETEIISLSRQAPDGGGAIMAADAFSRAGRHRAVMDLLEPWKFVLIEASEFYARSLIKAGLLQQAMGYVIDNRVHYNAKAEVFCALRDKAAMQEIQTKVTRSDRPWLLFQKESLSPRSAITAGTPPDQALFLSMIQRLEMGTACVRLAIDTMRMALERSEPVGPQPLLQNIRHVTPDELQQVGELLVRMKNQNLMNDAAAMWGRYKVDFLAANYASAWQNLSLFNQTVAAEAGLSKQAMTTEPAIPLKREHLESDVPIILVFGMSRSGKSTLAAHIAMLAPHLTFLDELTVAPTFAELKVIQNNLRVLRTVHPKGVVLTVPFPHEMNYMALLGGKQVKTIVVHRGIEDLAFAAFEKNYINKNTHSYTYSFPACEKIARFYQECISAVLLAEGKGHLVRYEDFGAEDKMDELSKYLGIGRSKEPLVQHGVGMSRVFRAEMDSALNGVV